MFLPETDRLLTLAEIAVAIAGFSAIVVIFKRREPGTWLAADADRFNGMIVHSIAAVVLCLLPMLIGVFTRDSALVWRIASAVMALQVGIHAALVAFWLASTGPRAALLLTTGGLLVVSLQVLNVLGVYFSNEAAPFVAGVIWHLLHAGMLFTVLVWVHRDAIER